MRDEQMSSLYNSNADSLSSPKELTKVQQQNRMLLKPSASRRRGKAEQEGLSSAEKESEL
jgi:hypothetical protein